jgi:hypothetical protein
MASFFIALVLIVFLVWIIISLVALFSVIGLLTLMMFNKYPPFNLYWPKFLDNYSYKDINGNSYDKSRLAFDSLLRSQNLEKYLKLDPFFSLEYSIHLKTRFIEAEEAIADSEYLMRYSLEVLGSRWPKSVEQKFILNSYKKDYYTKTIQNRIKDYFEFWNDRDKRLVDKPN